MDFHRAAELIDVGRMLAIRTLDAFEAEEEGEADEPEDPSTQ